MSAVKLEGRWGSEPLFAAGLRIDPPISVPIPKQLPRNPTIAPSPPDDPPEVRVVLNGFFVTLPSINPSVILPFHPKLFFCPAGSTHP
jgi:hypothetical protein